MQDMSLYVKNTDPEIDDQLDRFIYMRGDQVWTILVWMVKK